MVRKSVLNLALGMCILISACSYNSNNLKTLPTKSFKSNNATNKTASLNNEKVKDDFVELEKANKVFKKTKTFSKVEIIRVPNLVNLPGSSVNEGLGGVNKDEKNKKPSSEIKKEEGDIQISVEDLPIVDFVNLIFGKILKVNYLIDPSVKNLRGKVSLKMTSPMGVKSFISFVEDVLKSYGCVVEKKNGFFIIKKGKRKKVTTQKISLKLIFGRELPDTVSSDEKVTFIMPLYYVNKNTIYMALKGMLGSEVYIKPYPFDKNALMLVGTVDSVKKVSRIILAFDRPFLEDKKFYLLSLDYLSPEEFIRDVKKILISLGIPISDNFKKEGLFLIPVKRKNAVFVVSSNEAWIDSLIYWKEKLDTLEEFGDEPQIFVYKPNNRSAEELMNVLKNIIDVLKVKNNVEESDSSKQKKKAKNREVFLVSKLHVSVDKERNSIVIYATPSDYKKLRRILERLDTLPKQVLIEVTIAEVTLTDQLQYGIEWYLKRTMGSDKEAVLQTLGGLGLGSAGLNFSFVDISKNIQLLLNNFKKKNLINIVSTPRIIVLDGREASISVGTEVPVILSETTTGDNATTSLIRSVQYRNTGVILNVKPVVISNNMLLIDVSQELSEAQSNSVSGIDSPIILNRSIKTSLVLKSGESVLLGGLISSNDSKTKAEVPILGKIPLLGYLFKTESKGKNRTELIVTITPHIINKYEDMNVITDKLLNSFTDMKENLNALW